MAAAFKGHAQRWLIENETNKITTAKELSDAVFANGGPPNTKMVVATIDKNIQKFIVKRKIPNISTFHSISFDETGFVCKEFFNIGEGKRFTYNRMFTFLEIIFFYIITSYHFRCYLQKWNYYKY